MNNARSPDKQRQTDVLKLLDAQLVEAACNGDVSSLGELYRRHYQMAVGIAYCCLSDHHLAEDAAQEAFAVACRKLATLRKTEQFASWLGTICRRIATRMKKTRLPNRAIDENEMSTADEAHEDSSTNVQRAVACLSKQEREVIILHYFSGLSYERIGSALGVTPQAVHGRLQRARRRLAEQLRLHD